MRSESGAGSSSEYRVSMRCLLSITVCTRGGLRLPKLREVCFNVGLRFKYPAERIIGIAQALKSVPEDERERAERKVKLRTLGNIRLIAELYKQDVVPEKILHACIQEMLGDGKSDPIEDNVEVGAAAVR